MMTISESNYSSNQMSSIRTVNDKVVHQDSFNDVQQSSSTNSALITKRGFKPSDMFDPQKKEFLTNLSYKLFPNDHPKSRDPSPTTFLLEGSVENEIEYHNTITEDFTENKSPITVGDKEIDLNKILRPAPDAEDHLIKKNKLSETAFASSSFYASGFHPTVKDQMELAKKISSSLSEPANQLSKGQSMYVNRKNRSVKWVHEGKGRNTSSTCATPSPSSAHDSPYRPPTSSYAKQQAQPKVGMSHTLPRSFPNAPKVNPVNTLPKMEPFPQAVSTLTPLPELYIPPLQTKLNDVYASPPNSKLSQWNGKNYNTAARGWGQVKTHYKPVTFDDAGNCNALPFSDF